MRIKKTYQSAVRDGKVLNSKNNSQNDTYSCDYINGTLLYESSGTSGHVELNDIITNYKRIDIVFRMTDGDYRFCETYYDLKEGQAVRISRSEVNIDRQEFYILEKIYRFQGNQMLKESGAYYSSAGVYNTYDNLAVIKVVGYK